MAAAAPARAQVRTPDPFGVSVSAGADYSSGDYGATTKTKIFIAPVSLTAKTEGLRFTASLPYLRIDGPGVVLGPDGRPLPGVTGAVGVRKGVGDLSLSGTASVLPGDSGGLAVEFTGRVKLPTSQKSKRLSTGKTDFRSRLTFHTRRARGRRS